MVSGRKQKKDGAEKTMGKLIDRLHNTDTTLRTIEVRGHTHTFLLDLERILERKYLNGSCIGQDKGAVIQTALAGLESDQQLRTKWAQMWTRLDGQFECERAPVDKKMQQARAWLLQAFVNNI